MLSTMYFTPERSSISFVNSVRSRRIATAPSVPFSPSTGRISAMTSLPHDVLTVTPVIRREVDTTSLTGRKSASPSPMICRAAELR